MRKPHPQRLRQLSSAYCASAFVPCQLTEDWLYDRGPGNLMATVRLRGGSVLSIVYGREPR